LKSAIIVLIILGNSFSLPAQNWPGLPVEVVSQFGTKLPDGRFEVEMGVVTESEETQAPWDGEVVFQGNLDNPWLRGWNDSRGDYLSLSGPDLIRLQISGLTFIPGNDKNKFQKGDRLGLFVSKSNNLNSPLSKYYALSVYNSAENRWLNPSQQFPTWLDNRDPVVVQAQVKGENGELILLGPRSTMGIGYWSIIVDVYDLTPGHNRPLAFQYLGGFLNGTPFFEWSWDQLQIKKGVYEGTDGVGVPQSSGTLWPLGRVFVNQGTNIFDLMVKDSQGNITRRTYRLIGSLRP